MRGAGEGRTNRHHKGRALGVGGVHPMQCGHQQRGGRRGWVHGECIRYSAVPVRGAAGVGAWQDEADAKVAVCGPSGWKSLASPSVPPMCIDPLLPPPLCSFLQRFMNPSLASMHC